MASPDEFDGMTIIFSAGLDTPMTFQLSAFKGMISGNLEDR
jgi:hypothetical protein